MGAAGATADDFMHTLVTSCTTGNDPSANSRTWATLPGTLVVAGAHSAAAALPADYEEYETYLDQALNAIGEAEDVVWELLPAIVAGPAVQFTFDTAYPRGGTDRTTGAARVIVDDYGGMAPSGSRTIQLKDVVSAFYTKGMIATVIDAARIATWGRWEGRSPVETQSEAQTDLDLAGPVDNAEWVAQAHSQNAWLTQWFVGDQVIRANTRLGIAGAAWNVDAVHLTWQDRRMNLAVEWGDPRQTASGKSRDQAHKPRAGDRYGAPVGSGGAGAIEYVGDANLAGTSANSAAEDHQHGGYLNAGGAVGFDPLTGQLALTSIGGTVTFTPNIPGHSLNLEVTAGLYAPIDAQYVVMALNPTLTQERVLTGGNGLTLTDGGAGGNATLTLGTPSECSAVTGNTVGAATHTHHVLGSNNVSGGGVSLVECDANGDFTMRDLTARDVYVTGSDVFGTVGARLILAANAELHSGTANVELYADNRINIRPNNALAWRFLSAGDFVPNGTCSYDIGNGSNRVDVLWVCSINISGNITTTGLVDGVDIANHTHDVTGNSGNTAPGINGNSANYTPAANAVCVDAAAPVGGGNPLNVWAYRPGLEGPGAAAWWGIFARGGTHGHAVGTYTVDNHNHDDGTYATGVPL